MSNLNTISLPAINIQSILQERRTPQATIKNFDAFSILTKNYNFV